jgi:NodT family efflux transporter outer membrane factor (OMF) lipoprotein
MTKFIRLPRRRAAACIVLATLLAGCAVGPNFKRPAPPSVSAYDAGPSPTATAAADATAQRFIDDAEVAGNWWTAFGSAPLNSAMTAALAANPGLTAAQENLRQSQDQLRAGYGVFFPQLNGDYTAEREKTSPLRFGENGPPSVFNLFTLSASVSYALDIFGGERRTVEGLAAQVDYQRQTVHATYLSLSANVANTLIASAAYRAELDAYRSLIDLQARQVKLAEVQARAGSGPYAAVLTLQSQLATSQAALPPLEQKLDQADHLLATLMGKPPGEVSPPSVVFADFTLPKDLPVTVPSELVRQRPDILAAEAQLHAASANIGVATAAMLPSVTLNASYGANQQSMGNLFGANSNFWSYGAEATAPLFHGGELWYQRKAAIDTFRAVSATYQQTVLSAFAQVADTLRALEHDAQTLDADNRAEATALRALKLVQATYQAGLANYTDVLVADAQYRQAVINGVQARALRYQDTVALFAAMGGGTWMRDRVATPAAP